MAEIVFFNQLSKLRNDPTLKNLVDLAAIDPLQADIEVNDLATGLSNLTPRENILWLLAYLQGLCTRAHLGNHQATIDELQGRLTKYWKGGDWRYRHPYVPRKSRVDTLVDPPEPPKKPA